MAKVRLDLNTGSLADAVRVADDIRNSGSVSYVDAEGATVNVTVGDVSVEDGS